MLSPGPGTRVYLAVGATDMRKSIDGLAALVAAALALDPLLCVECEYAAAARQQVTRPLTAR